MISGSNYRKASRLCNDSDEDFGTFFSSADIQLGSYSSQNKDLDGSGHVNFFLDGNVYTRPFI